MRSSDHAAAADLIRRAHDITAQASTDYEQDHSSPWTCNTKIHYRQSTIIALLRAHTVLDVVEDRYVEWGRVKIVDSEGGPPFLLKPRASLLYPAASTDTTTQLRIPGIDLPSGEPLLAYDLHGDSCMLHEGLCRQIRQNERNYYQIVGELRLVWTGGEVDHVQHFDQGEDADWTNYLDEEDEETGTSP